ncbi:MAG TPA: ATP-binding protein [Candidatus Krumholzibacteriaceae bacterium]|nr:ATP-binding protein [Candidatus Krumholzibacteriaceae bacterium]
MINDNSTILKNVEADSEKKQLSAVMEIANIVNSRLDLEHVLSRIAREMNRAVDYDIGCVAIHDKDNNCLNLRHIYRKSGDDSYEGSYVPLDESNIIGWVAINRKPIYRKDIRKDNRFEEIMKEDNLGSDVVIPLMAKGSFIGTLNVGSYEPDHFSDLDLELIKNFSRLTSIAVGNSIMLDDLTFLGNKYKNLMNNAKDIITLLDLSGKVIECSDSIERVFGYTKDEIIGKEIFEFTIPDRRGKSKNIVTRVIKGELSRLTDIPYAKKNGDIVYLDVDVSIMRLRNNPYILSIAHNITERKILEEKIRSKNLELVEKNRKLVDLDRLKNEFLGRVSHELRTPLSVIMAYVDSLKGEDELNPIDAETKEEFLDVIFSQSSKLLGIINDLLDLSKVEISNTMLDIVQGSINEIVRISAKSVEREADSKSIKVLCDLDENIPIINFDVMRVQQVCVNLLGNAVKFTKEGEEIIVHTSCDEEEVVVSISDKAPRIKDEDINRIFMDFTQIDGGTSRSRDGMGVGLRLVKHYVDLHGGRVWIDRREPEGNIFSFSIPTDINLDKKSNKVLESKENRS